MSKTESAADALARLGIEPELELKIEDAIDICRYPIGVRRAIARDWLRHAAEIERLRSLLVEEQGRTKQWHETGDAYLGTILKHEAEIERLRTLLGEAYNFSPPELRMKIGIELDGEDDSDA